MPAAASLPHGSEHGGRQSAEEKRPTQQMWKVWIERCSVRPLKLSSPDISDDDPHTHWILAMRYVRKTRLRPAPQQPASSNSRREREPPDCVHGPSQASFRSPLFCEMDFGAFLLKKRLISASDVSSAQLSLRAQLLGARFLDTDPWSRPRDCARRTRGRLRVSVQVRGPE